MPPSDAALAARARRVAKQLMRGGQRLATAESCTGGLIAKTLTDLAGSSAWFEQGWVTYSNRSKQAALGVGEGVLARHGAVSEQVARAMARGARTAAGVEQAVAVTGVAGPGGGSALKPIGTVWIAWARRRGGAVRVTTRLYHFPGNREAVRRRTVAAALDGLLEP
ncbi:MAG: CinA family protein [Steroidobacteraceae bacterium]